MTQEKQSDEQYSLISLSPKNDLYKNQDDKKEYLYYRHILDNSLTDINNNNVAISGKYGSGKSSLIYSYFNDDDSKIKKESTLKINFSNLNENNIDDSKKNKDDNTSNTRLVNEISLSIINQIIYQIDYNKIPLTHFKIKKEISKKQAQKILPIIVVVMLAIMLKLFNIVLNYWVALAIIVVFLFYFGYSFLNLIFNFDLKKIKIGFKNIEANINYENDDFFEKYVDEIIYLFTSFENNKKPKNNKIKNYVLLIEDLDRFNDTDIFRKLKNLNIKLNQKSKNHWIFLYLIKDDLFESSTERTKFFDLIIPVIPFITTSNSYDKLKELFKDDEIEDNLLFYVSQFIDDYRLLLNIKNEYEVFKQVTTSGKNDKELFSLIVYKNIYPNEFDETQNGKGILSIIKDNYINNIENSITNEENKIQDIEESTLLEFANENGYKFGNNEYFYTFNELQNKADARKIINNNLFLAKSYDEYIRYDSLENKDAGYFACLVTNNYYSEKENLEKLKHYNLSSINDKIMGESNNNEYDSDEFNFLFGLIKEKYITVNYLNTINHFYENPNNIIFMNKIARNTEQFDITLPLDNIKLILRRLSNNRHWLERPQILNIDLFKYVLDNESFIYIANRIIYEAEKVDDNSSGYHFIENFIKYINNHPNDYNDDYYIDKIYNIDSTLMLNINDMNLSDGALIKVIKYNIYADNETNRHLILDKASKFSSSDILDIINTDNVSISLKKEIIDYLDKIDFSKVNNKELWNELIKKDKIAPTFDNVMTYHNEMEESSKEFYKFINNVDIPYKNIEDEPDEKTFINSLIFNNNITVDTVKEIVSHLNLDIVSSEKAIELNNDKFQLLLDYKLIDLKNNDILNYIANNPIDVSKGNQYVEIVNNLDSRYDNDDRVEIKNEKLLNCAIKKYDLKSFKFVSRRLGSIENLNLVDYLKNMKGNLNSYKNDLNKLIRIINNEKGCFNMRVKNDSNGIILNIAEFMKSEKYISGYDFTKNNKIKFYK